jgi:hypothetical protein
MAVTTRRPFLRRMVLILLIILAITSVGATSMGLSARSGPAVEQASSVKIPRPVACDSNAGDLRGSADLANWSLQFLSSDESRSFIANIKSPDFIKAKARAGKDMRGRGFKPVDAPLVVKFKNPNAANRTGLLARFSNWFLPRLHAQDYYHADTGQGYIAVFPWDDGNPGTFEANSFTQHNNGRYWDIDNQMWIGAGNHQLMWAHGWTGGRGRAPRQISQICGDGCQCNGRAAECMFRRSINNSRNFCAGSAIGCRFSGAKWWACVSGACTARIVGELLTQGERHFSNCMNGC